MVEGTIYHGPKGTGKYFMFHDRPFRNWILDLAKIAHYTMAIGTCSSRLDRRNSHWSNFGKTRHCRARWIPWPKMFYNKLAHHACPRDEYYEFKASAERLVNEPEESLQAKLEMVVRVYDPCISCSVHLVRLTSWRTTLPLNLLGISFTLSFSPIFWAGISFF